MTQGLSEKILWNNSTHQVLKAVVHAITGCGKIKIIESTERTLATFASPFVAV